ncbi:nucleoside recognition domain-containing protein [Candidatus Chrysopegis kryptomonas]|uniref:Spore maturation protein SpmA n=1 Tax=Candidatus Chryseopegocella kryptomonas TaxID=1633643 RepID=A0A0P1NZ40_9BACT|nr:nucleoside recognition domain-containing protein [Candidatus Chrysopegis kryptomonas]CUT04298.1 Spore maturation protein SpmA [Candidatus Chrysopegis kryptomonas]
MMNYIWLALIAIGILTAVGTDIYESSINKYRNGVEFQALVELKDEFKTNTQLTGILKVSGEYFKNFYSLKNFNAKLITNEISIKVNQDGKGVAVLNISENTPEFWKLMAKGKGTNTDKLVANILKFEKNENGSYNVVMVFERISLVKIKQVLNAVIEYSDIAVKIAIGLIGVMALWLGIMKIGELAGLINLLAKIVKPITKRLFPDIPSEHPAIGAIIMNISANMLGLGNAATPLGLKAMEELQKLNPKKDTASDSMVTFLVINTSGMTLIPATAIAVRAALGSGDPAAIISTTIVGGFAATIAGVTAAKILQRLKIFRKELEENNETKTEVKE